MMSYDMYTGGVIHLDTYIGEFKGDWGAQVICSKINCENLNKILELILMVLN